MLQSSLYTGNTPVTFLSWLESQNTVSADYKENFVRYQTYVQDWIERNKEKKSIGDDFFYSFYIDVLKDITLNFATEEERRFIVNFDYSVEDNLDIILPFFIEKLKNICLYYSEQREKLKENIRLAPYKGTNFYIQKFVKNLIIENYDTGYVIKKNEGKVSFPSLSAITKSLDVYVEEVYDDESYYNVDPTDSLKNSFGNIDVDVEVYTDFKEAIKKAIKEYPLFLNNFTRSISLNYTLSGGELFYLKNRDFINYFNTLSSNDLKLNIKKQLFPKYASTDFYYLSVGNSINNFVSGALFNVNEYTNKTSNLTNRRYSTIATVPSLNDLYTSYEMGKFFIPSKTGVLQYNTFKKTTEIDKTKLKPNTLYVIPDPEVFEIQDSPITYRIDVSWAKEDLGSGFRFGEVLGSKHFQRFYGYQSYSQELGQQPHGLSLTVDNIDFWAGANDSDWTESDLWPGTDKVEKLPIDARLDSLLFNEGTCTHWFTDVFGNEFGLFKNITDSTGYFDKKRNVPGKFFIKNTVTNLVSTGNHFLKTIYKKYPEKVLNELEENLYSVYVNRALIVFETKNYVCVDSYNFDLTNGEFLINLLPGLYIPKFEINEYLEKYIGHFYIDKTEEVFLCFLKLLPPLSASNYKSLYPTIYKISLNNLSLEQIYPGNSLKAEVYSLSANFKDFPEVSLKYVEGGKFTFKEKFNLFNLTYLAYNENNVPFTISEQFSIENNTNNFVSYTPLLHKPYYYVHDTNFANPGIDTSFRFGSNYSELAGHKKTEQFKWSMEGEKYDNYYFCSKINPVFINYQGTHFVQFDWAQYLNGNIFIGCENLQATYIDNRNFITFKNKITLLEKEEVWYNVGNVTFSGINFTLSAYKPYKSTGNIVGFSITSTEAPSGFIFCEDLFSIYRTVNLVIAGSGSGIVTSDPFCIECEKKTVEPVRCSFQYPLCGTITFKASAYTNNLFRGWRGSQCDGSVGNCFYTTTETNNITAVFNKVPRFTVRIQSNLPETTTVLFDGGLSANFCYNTTCSYEYNENTLVAVSAGPAPFGYRFEKFDGINQGTNNPVTFNMNRNYSLTATYVSATNDIELINYFNIGGRDERKFGRIVGTPSNVVPGLESFEILLTQPDTVLAWCSGAKNTGSLTCSLCPDLDITGFATLKALRGTTITITGSSVNPIYIFDYFRGSPCDRAPGVCTFPLTINRSISAFFNYPYYRVSIDNIGDELFYTVSNDGNLDAGTFALGTTRNKTSYNYVSGTVISLSTFSFDLDGNNRGGVRYIDAVTVPRVLPPPESFITGATALVLKDYLITQSVVITAFCESDDARPPLSISKSSLPGVTTAEILRPKIFSGTLDNVITDVSENNTFKTITKYPPFQPILMFTRDLFTLNHLYTSGKDVYIDLEPQLPLAITNSTNQLNEETVILDTNLIRLVGDLQTPLYVDNCERLLNIEDKVYYTVLTSPVTAAFVYAQTCSLGSFITTININTINRVPGQNPPIPAPRVNSWSSYNTTGPFSEYNNLVGPYLTGAGQYIEFFPNVPSDLITGIDIFAFTQQTITTQVLGGTNNVDYTIIDSTVENGTQRKRQVRLLKFGNYTLNVSIT